MFFSLNIFDYLQTEYQFSTMAWVANNAQTAITWIEIYVNIWTFWYIWIHLCTFVNVLIHLNKKIITHRYNLDRDLCQFWSTLWNVLIHLNAKYLKHTAITWIKICVNFWMFSNYQSHCQNLNQLCQLWNCFIPECAFKTWIEVCINCGFLL